MATGEVQGLRKRKQLARKERIFRTALDLFRRKGFSATTVEEIAAAAEVGKGTFFNYFPTKEAVLLYLGERQALRLYTEIGAALASPQLSALARLKLLLRTLAEGLEPEKALTRIVVYETIKAPDIIAGDAQRVVFHNALLSLVREGQTNGEIRTEADAELVVAALEGLYFYEVFRWCASPEPYSLAVRLVGMVDLLLEGVGAERSVGGGGT
jgi:AcrR family transcriptional regulator